MIKFLKENDELYEKKAIIENILQERIFENIAINPYEELQKIAPLLRYYDANTIDEIKFLHKNERLKAAILKNEESADLINSIASDINALSRNINAVIKKEDKIKEVLNPQFWQKIDLASIDDIKSNFAPLMKYRNPEKPKIIVTDIEDDIIERRMIEYSE
jgi:type I site-specific restriction endonuclease